MRPKSDRPIRILTYFSTSIRSGILKCSPSDGADNPPLLYQRLIRLPRRFRSGDFERIVNYKKFLGYAKSKGKKNFNSMPFLTILNFI